MRTMTFHEEASAEVKETPVGSLRDFAQRQRCWQNLRPEPCQEIRPVGLVRNNRLLVVATSGEAVEGAQVFHAEVASYERGAKRERGARSSNDPISHTKARRA